MNQAAQYIRRELAIRLVRAFDAGNLREEIDQIAVKMRPKNEPSSRCCVYHDRAVIKYRLMALLGYSTEDESDEAKSCLGLCNDDKLGGAPYVRFNGTEPMAGATPDKVIARIRELLGMEEF